MEDQIKKEINIKGIKKVRSRNVDEWKKVKAKKNRSRGLEYVNTSGKLIPARIFEDTICNCKGKCNEKINPDERRKVFDQFYELGNQTLQNLYLRGQVQIQEVRRHRPKDKTRSEKTQSFYYYIRIGKKNVKVCKKYFRDTFQVGNSRLHRSCSVENIVDLMDKRGRKQASNKVDTKDAEDHILSFPTYTDQNAKGVEARRKYLDCSLTLQEMYDSYVAHSEANDKKPVKKSMYYHVMRSKFQIYFPKPPSKEQIKKETPQSPAMKKVIKITKDEVLDQPSTSSQTIIYNTVESTLEHHPKTVITPTFVYAQPITQTSKGFEGLSFVQQIASPIKTSSTAPQVIILKDQGITVPANQNQNIIYYSSASNSQGEQMIFYQ